MKQKVFHVINCETGKTEREFRTYGKAKKYSQKMANKTHNLYYIVNVATRFASILEKKRKNEMIIKTLLAIACIVIGIIFGFVWADDLNHIV